jgi:hypothetical protein
MAVLATADPFQPIPRTKDLEYLQQWIEETDSVLFTLKWLLQCEARQCRNFQSLQAIVHQFASVDDASMEAQLGQHFRDSMRGKPQLFLELFRREVFKVDALAQKLHSRLEDITAFRQRRLSVNSLHLPFYAILVTFVTGVLLPAVWHRTYRLFALLVPIVLYLGLFAHLLYTIRQ